MFLLEVFGISLSSEPQLFKRIMADSIQCIKNWIEANAQDWTAVPALVEYDGDVEGAVYRITAHGNELAFEFCITPIEAI